MPLKKRKQQSEAEAPAPAPPSAPASSSSWWGWLLGGGSSSSSASSSSASSNSAGSALAPGSLPPTYVEGFHDEAAVRSMTYRRLGETGMVSSVLSLGASSLGGVFRDQLDDDEAVDLVVQAVRSGINLIDTAPWYGQGKSERVLGRALKQIPREAYYLTTKVGRYEKEEERMFDFTAARVTQSVYESMGRLGVTYIDSIQVHDPEFAPSLDIVLHETLPALHKLKELGLVRHVGITGYPLSVLRRLLEESPVPIDTVLSYCHHSINDTTLVPQLLPLLQAKGVGLINASPLSMGLMTPRGPPAWHPAHAEQKRICREAVGYCEAQGVDVTKLALWFSLFSDARIPTTLVSTSSLQNILHNLEVARAGPIQLSSKERKVLDHLQTKIFAPLKGKEDWGGVEVNAYWAAIGKRVVLRDIYGGLDLGAAAAAAAAAGGVGSLDGRASKAAAATDRRKRQRV